jgi:mRNA interferase HigB
MVIITKSKLHEFAAIHSDAEDSLDEWYRKTKNASWSNIQEVKETFNSVDYVGNSRFVFNIRGNRYRIVAMIHFNKRTLYIRFIGTHSEYDNILAASI